MASIVALSEAASIGLHSMVLIAKSKEVLNVGQIAEKICSSRHHVAKIMQRLAKQGFVTSNRGPNGGFTLRKSAKETSLLDIYEAIEGKLDVEICPGGKEVCPFDKCILGDISTRISIEIKDYFQKKTLSDYL